MESFTLLSQLLGDWSVQATMPVTSTQAKQVKQAILQIMALTDRSVNGVRPCCSIDNRDVTSLLSMVVVIEEVASYIDCPHAVAQTQLVDMIA